MNAHAARVAKRPIVRELLVCVLCGVIVYHIRENESQRHCQRQVTSRDDAMTIPVRLSAGQIWSQRRGQPEYIFSGFSDRILRHSCLSIECKAADAADAVNEVHLYLGV